MFEVIWSEYDQPRQYIDGSTALIRVLIKDEKGKVANTGTEYDTCAKAEIAYQAMRLALRTAGLLLDRE